MSYVQIACIPMRSENQEDFPVTTVINEEPLTRTKIQALKLRKILGKSDHINDVIERTWLKFHPSIGKSDKVVWEYEILRDEFAIKYRGYH
jgi:hypothetical protein